MTRNEQLVPLFIPALVVLLASAEDRKGSPLTEEEALHIRDNAACIMMEREHALKMGESRGYRDIDPENCWYDWQMARREMGREPELPAGARFTYVPSGDEAFKNTVQHALETIGDFRRLILNLAGTRAVPMIKVEIVEADYRAFMWLSNATPIDGGFSGELFEVPIEFKDHAVGDRLNVPEADVLDWMVNDGGRLYGGFSLRLQRARLPESEQKSFDEYIGVTEYA